MTKEITVNAPEGANVEIMQTISQPADLQVGPVKVGDASVLTWNNAGIVVVLIAAAAIRNINPDSSNKEKDLLLSAFDSDDEHICSLVIKQMKDDNEILPDEKLIKCLNEESVMVRNAALSVSRTRISSVLLPHIIKCLSDPRSVIPARSALKVYDDDQVIKLFIENIQNQNIKTLKSLQFLMVAMIILLK